MPRAQNSLQLPASIRAITFDVDDTLFDFQACMTRSAEAVLQELYRRVPPAAAVATQERFRSSWEAATEEARAQGGMLVQMAES